MGITAKHIVFTGRVQGVGFRFTALRIAKRWGLRGIVRNLPDGSVEMTAQGSDEDLNQCLQEINGYFGSYIKEKTIEEVAASTRYEDFRITF